MAGIDGFGVVLARSDMAPTTPVFTPIANITNLGGPGIARETPEVTAHDSPDAWREFVGGLKDAGELTADINYDPEVHDTLLADLADDIPRKYRVAWPGGGVVVWELDAILTGFEPEAPFDDKLAASTTWKLSGKPNFDAGA